MSDFPGKPADYIRPSWHPALRQPSETVQPDELQSDRLWRGVEFLRWVVDKRRGSPDALAVQGFAAVQANVPGYENRPAPRVMLVPHPDAIMEPGQQPDMIVVANGQRTYFAGRQQYREGCASITGGFLGRVEHSEAIGVHGLVLDEGTRSFQGEHLPYRDQSVAAVEHELRHQKGSLFTDAVFNPLVRHRVRPDQIPMWRQHCLTDWGQRGAPGYPDGLWNVRDLWRETGVRKRPLPNLGGQNPDQK
jgi:peptide deformylase